MYVATISQPGYLPDTEPAEFETVAEAWEYLAEEYAYHNDGAAAINFHQTGTGDYLALDGYVYSVDVAE